MTFPVVSSLFGRVSLMGLGASSSFVRGEINHFVHCDAFLSLEFVSCHSPPMVWFAVGEASVGAG